MGSLGLSRVLGATLALAFLAGCSEAQQAGIVPQGTRNQSPALQASGSWMLPEAKHENLLYVSLSPAPSNGKAIVVFSYPQGKLVGSLSFTKYYPMGLCTDAKGYLFVTTFQSGTAETSQVYEFSHAGTKPIATLSDPGLGNDCAVDPKTGNLAVANWFGGLGSFDHGSVAIYQGAQGTATPYYDPNIYWYEWCVYDNSGNLYVDGYNEGGGYPLAEIPEDSSSFENLSINDEDISLGGLQWFGGDLIVDGWQWEKNENVETLYRVQFSGSAGTIVGSTTISTRTKARKRHAVFGQYAVNNQSLIGVGFNDPEVHYWQFPEGGLPTKSLPVPYETTPYGVAVSIARRN